MYKNLWRMNKEAHIGGDSYIYIPDINTCQILKNVNTFFIRRTEPKFARAEIYNHKRKAFCG